MDRLSLGGVLLLICLIGLLQLLRRRSSLSERAEFGTEFSEKFKQYYSSGGKDSEAYGWMIHRSNRMQLEMGGQGIYAAYRPPFASFQYRNYPIILNMLPDLRNALADSVLSRENSLAHQYAMALQESLVRHLGTLCDLEEEILKSIRNPAIWLREGVRFILVLPITLLGWLGVFSLRTVEKVTESRFLKFIAGVVGLVGFVSSLMGIILGWQDFKQLLSNWVAF